MAGAVEKGVLRACLSRAYGAVQVWTQAAEKVGSLELEALIASFRQHQFDTMLGLPCGSRATAACFADRGV
jgi:hypothetical protein